MINASQLMPVLIVHNLNWVSEKENDFTNIFNRHFKKEDKIIFCGFIDKLDQVNSANLPFEL